MTTIPNTMQGIVLTGHGDFDQLAWRDDIPTPQPKPHEVLVKVHAAGVNNTDINTRLAWYAKGDSTEDATWNGGSLDFPRIQGADVCGYIVAVGDNIANTRIGERVLINPCIWQVDGQRLQRPWYFGSECDGGFAQYTTVDSSQAHAIHSSYSDIELASFPCSYSTAENMLIRAQVGKNDTVLITGASGGVGSAAVQLASARGATVIAICASEKAAAIQQLGANQTATRHDDVIETFGKNSIDVVIDLVGGAQWGALLEVLKPYGRYAVAGAIGGADVKLDLRTLYLKDLRFFGCTALEANAFSNVVQRIENQHIQPLIAQVFPLKEIVQAQQLFLSKQLAGNVVLSVAQ